MAGLCFHYSSALGGRSQFLSALGFPRFPGYRPGLFQASFIHLGANHLRLPDRALRFYGADYVTPRFPSEIAFADV